MTTDTALPFYDPCAADCKKAHGYRDPNLPSQLGAIPKKIVRPAPSTPQNNARSAAQLLNQQTLTEFDRQNNAFQRTQSFKDPQAPPSFSSFGRPGPQTQQSVYEMQPPPGIHTSSDSLLPPPPPPRLDSNGFETAEFQF